MKLINAFEQFGLGHLLAEKRLQDRLQEAVLPKKLDIMSKNISIHGCIRCIHS